MTLDPFNDLPKIGDRGKGIDMLDLPADSPDPGPETLDAARSPRGGRARDPGPPADLPVNIGDGAGIEDGIGIERWAWTEQREAARQNGNGRRRIGKGARPEPSLRQGIDVRPVRPRRGRKRDRR